MPWHAKFDANVGMVLHIEMSKIVTFLRIHKERRSGLSSVGINKYIHTVAQACPSWEEGKTGPLIGECNGNRTIFLCTINTAEPASTSISGLIREEVAGGGRFARPPMLLSVRCTVGSTACSEGYGTVIRGGGKNPQGSPLAPKILNRFPKAGNHVFLLQVPQDALKSSRRRRCRR
jgi:hypothetical protein